MMEEEENMEEGVREEGWEIGKQRIKRCNRRNRRREMEDEEKEGSR